MKKFLILIMFLLLSCSSPTPKSNFKFSEDMTFDEFRLKLEEYAKKKPYPKADD